MQRILMIRDDPTAAQGIQESLQLPHSSITVAEGDADTLQRLRFSAFDVILTSPKSTINEDLSLITEIERIRPGVRTIILALKATPEDIIAALRARVFAKVCHTKNGPASDLLFLCVQVSEGFRGWLRIAVCFTD